MECRKEAKRRYYEGALPGFDPATRYIREGDWTCAPVPPAVADRKVEITGPVERKIIINALNSGAQVFMVTMAADFEDDGLSPSWEKLVRGQVNLEDAVDGTFTFDDKARNRVCMLNDQIAKLSVRPRGWHLPEAHILIDGEPAAGCLVDFGLYFYHNYAAFRRIHEKMAVIERGSIRATVLIETLPVVFQMNEILYELRDHSVGMNCGRWDYIFSYAKTFQAHPARLLRDRIQVSMTQHFMKSYSDLLIWTCHNCGVHAMAWLTGTGSVPLYNLMEDAATAEISRVQNWQWLKFRVELDGDGLGVKVNNDLFGKVVEEEMARIGREVGKDKFKMGMYREACRIFTGQRTAPALDDFLTLNAYNNIDIYHPVGSSSL
ncbi:hypothetical protein POTOM_043233 [Populus tomentosa]|uniref:Malate synthase TIM barrel domain-containing protein n=1 Tax=Populus tomentosa TaxID=118781 RepID=A0A8X8CGH4_POPTO|nr:hypothetical protein POTOM_043233 [Populus tomentosa]